MFVSATCSRAAAARARPAEAPRPCATLFVALCCTQQDMAAVTHAAASAALLPLVADFLESQGDGLRAAAAAVRAEAKKRVRRLAWRLRSRSAHRACRSKRRLVLPAQRRTC